MDEERIAQGLELGIGVAGILSMIGAVALLVGRVVVEVMRSARFGEERHD